MLDRSYKVPVILDLSQLSDEDKSKTLELIAEHNPVKMRYPSDHAVDAARDLSRRGWPNLARKMPLTVSTAEAVQIFAMSVKAHGENLTIRREPSLTNMNRTVNEPNDFVRIVDELTAQQDDITLTLFFGTHKSSTNVYWTDKPNVVDAKVSHSVLKVNSLGKNEKDINRRIGTLNAHISRAIEECAENDKISFKDANTKKEWVYK